MANRLGQAVRESTRRLEPAVRRHERAPSGAHVLSVGLDRTTIPMEEPAPPGRQGPLRKRRKPYVRSPPPPVEVNYRMAYVGTVALIDADGDSIWSRRYAASAEEGPEQVLHRMMQDVRWARRTRPKLPVLVVQDAAPEMWKLLRDALNGELSVATWHEVIDRYHFAERLATIVETLAVSDRTKLLAEWQEAIDELDEAVDDIKARVDAELERGYIGKARRTLYEQQTYLENNSDRLRYATLMRRGFPIGSGITEAACKSVVTQRTKRSGQRWHSEGVEGPCSPQPPAQRPPRSRPPGPTPAHLHCPNQARRMIRGRSRPLQCPQVGSSQRQWSSGGPPKSGPRVQNSSSAQSASDRHVSRRVWQRISDAE